MYPFKFRNPTELIFGQGMVTELSKRISRQEKLLITFGGGSVRRNGVYDDVMKALEGYDIVEFWGIEPNPKVETLRRAVELGKREEVTFILAVGGGSVLDGSKLLANAIVSDLDAWELVRCGVDRSVSSLPLGTVLTIPATGSEMNRGGVISSVETKEKYSFVGDYPRFSILDPGYTASLPAYQIACGIVDTYVHVMEQYLCKVGESPLMDRWAEGILLTLIEEADAIRATPVDLEARATFMLSATMALNGFISMGVSQDWATHRIGHELTALTELTHGHTLAIVLPALMRTIGKTLQRDKLLQYAERIWRLTSGSEDSRIDEAIERTEAFFRNLGLETRLSERGIGTEVTEEILRRFAERNDRISYCHSLSPEIIAEVLRSAY